MDGFFLAVFLAVCIVVAVVLRCLCYRCCMQSCSDKFRHSNEDGILPRQSNPTITPAAGRSHRPQQHSPQLTNRQSRPVLPPAGTVFTIYTFPQQPSPELSRPDRSPGPPKYSHIPADSPPKYEDLFPITSKADTSSPSIAIEMQVTQSQQQQQNRHPASFSESHEPPVRDSVSVQAQTSSSNIICSPEPSFIPAVPTGSTMLSSNVRVPSLPVQEPPVRVPKEDPPLYDTIYPQKSGE